MNPTTESGSTPLNLARESSEGTAATLRGARRGSGRLLLWILLLFTAAFFAGQARRPLTDSSEARYSELAREMLTSGNWWIPTLNGLPHLTKPPLTTWLMSASMVVLGKNEAGARLPGVLAFLLTVLLVGRLARLLGRPEASAWTAFLYFLSVGPLVAATFPTTDTLLTFFEVAAVTAYLAHRNGSPAGRWAFYAALGAAFLTKGPPGLLVPAAVVLGDRLARRPADATARSRPSLFRFGLGWLVFAVVGLSWYAIVAMARPHTLSYWLGGEVVDRVFTNRYGRNDSPLVYLLALAGGLFPWWFLVPGFVARRFRSVFSRWRDDTPFLLLSWLFLPLLVFTISRSRLALYVLPLFPAIILALALHEPRRLDSIPGRWFGLRRGLVLAYLVLLLGVSWGSVGAARSSSWKQEARQVRDALAGQKPELILFHQGRVNSLQFYLGQAGRIVTPPARQAASDSTRRPESLPRLESGTGGSSVLLLLTKGKREHARLKELRPFPAFLAKKERYSLWIWPPAARP